MMDFLNYRNQRDEDNNNNMKIQLFYTHLLTQKVSFVNEPNHFLYYDSAKYHENDLNNRGIRRSLQ